MIVLLSFSALLLSLFTSVSTLSIISALYFLLFFLLVLTGATFLISVPARTELYAASPFFYASRPPSLPFSLWHPTGPPPTPSFLPSPSRPGALGFFSAPTGPPPIPLVFTLNSFVPALRRRIYRPAPHPSSLQTAIRPSLSLPQILRILTLTCLLSCSWLRLSPPSSVREHPIG